MKVFKKNIEDYNVEFYLMSRSEWDNNSYYYHHFLRWFKENNFSYSACFICASATKENINFYQQAEYLKHLTRYFGGINVNVIGDIRLDINSIVEKSINDIISNKHCTSIGDENDNFLSSSIYNSNNYWNTIRITPTNHWCKNINKAFLNENNIYYSDLFPIAGKCLPAFKTYFDSALTLNEVLSNKILFICDNQYYELYNKYLEILFEQFYKDILISLKRQLSAIISTSIRSAKLREAMDEDNIDWRSWHKEAINENKYHDDIISEYSQKIADAAGEPKMKKRLMPFNEYKEIKKAKAKLEDSPQNIFKSLENKSLKELKEMFYSNITWKDYYHGKLNGTESDLFYLNYEDDSEKIDYTNYEVKKKLHYLTDLTWCTASEPKLFEFKYNKYLNSNNLNNYNQHYIELFDIIFFTSIAKWIVGYNIEKFYKEQVYHGKITNNVLSEAIYKKSKFLKDFPEKRPPILMLNEYKEKNDKQIKLSEISAACWDEKYKQNLDLFIMDFVSPKTPTPWKEFLKQRIKNDMLERENK